MGTSDGHAIHNVNIYRRVWDAINAEECSTLLYHQDMSFVSMRGRLLAINCFQKNPNARYLCKKPAVPKVHKSLTPVTAAIEQRLSPPITLVACPSGHLTLPFLACDLP